MTSTLTRKPAAEPLRRQGLALPLRLAVLHPVRAGRAVPADLHVRGVAQRLGPAQGPGRVGRLRELRHGAGRPVLLELDRQHHQHLPASRSPPADRGAVIAAVLDQNLRAKTFWRMSVLLPYVVTPVAVTLIFSSMFNEAYGLANNLAQPGRHRRHPVEARHLPQPPRDRDHGQLALDRLQRADPAGRDAGGSARPLRVRRDRRRRRGPPLLLDHAPQHPADPHLRHHHRDHRRAADLRRAEALRRRTPAASAGRTASSRPRCSTSGTWRSSAATSARPRRSPGCCSC